MNGFINFYKPPRMSSGHAVALVKRLFHEKAGHGGTLDPDACGVLPIMLGQAARLFDYLVDKQKTYVADVCFGTATDTQDASGRVIATGSHLPDEAAIRAALPAFEGDILQTPPMYSALHVDGKRLYELARDGKTVELEARPVRVDHVRFLGRISDSVCSIEVTCRRGVYIRTLCHDLGALCDCPAHMQALERTRSGSFLKENAVSPEQLAEDPTRYVLPIDAPLEHLKRLDVCSGNFKQAINGMPLPVSAYSALTTPCEGEFVRVSGHRAVSEPDHKISDGDSPMTKARELLAGIRCFMLDMDGTFYLGNRLIDGSLDFLSALKRTGREALFLTNNSSRSGSFYIDKLKRMGVTPPFLRVLTSGQAAARHVMNAFPGQKAYVLGNHILKDELEQMGLVISENDPDYVLIAYDTELDYTKMTRVCDLVRAGLPYIATHPDFNCPTETGFAPDIGAIIAFIKASAGREPDLIIGKPYAGIVKDALAETGLPSSALAMVGDRLYTDIRTGVDFGMTSILVLSGETDREALEASTIKPTLTYGRLSDIIPDL